MQVKNAWGFYLALVAPALPLREAVAVYLGSACNQISFKRTGRQLLTQRIIWDEGDRICSTAIRQRIQGQI